MFDGSSPTGSFWCAGDVAAAAVVALIVKHTSLREFPDSIVVLFQ